MLTLEAQKGGAQEFILGNQLEQITQQLLFNTARLLAARSLTTSSIILASHNWRIYAAENGLGDSFYVLFANVSLPHYEYLREHHGETQVRTPFSEIREVMNELIPSQVNVRFIACELEQIQPPVDWQAQFAKAVTVLSSNQALFTYKNCQKIVYQGLSFRSQTEVKIFNALTARNLLVFPLPVAVLGQDRPYREPDFVVFHNFRCGILEVHGEPWHPPERAAEEAERRRLFGALGIRCYEVFDAQRCWNSPDQVVDEFLEALNRT